MMGKEQDTYRAAFIYMGTCLPWTSCFTLKLKAGPGCPRETGCAGWASAATKLCSAGIAPGLSSVGHAVDLCEKCCSLSGHKANRQRKNFLRHEKICNDTDFTYLKGCGQKRE